MQSALLGQAWQQEREITARKGETDTATLNLLPAPCDSVRGQLLSGWVAGTVHIQGRCSLLSYANTPRVSTSTR